MLRNIYKYTSYVYSADTRPLTTHSIDVTVVVELASRIQDLPHNETCELLAHGINPIGRVNFIPDSTHLSFWKKGLIY
jgi:hypothetical protein